MRHLVPSRPHALAAALVAALLAGSASAQVTPPGADLASLLAYARQNNPELASMRREADAASRRVDSAAALPDPVLRIELENVNNYGNGGGFNVLPWRVGDTKYTLMQQIPAPGKLDLRRSAAQADARQAQARAGATWTEQAMRIRTAYAQYYLATRNERVTQEILDLMTRLEQVAQARYAGGVAPQQDAIRAQLEQTSMRSELISVANEKRQLRARLNGLLARDADAPLAEPQSLPAPPAPGALSRAILLEKARNANPTVAAEAARLQSAQANRDLALRSRYPDFNVGISPTQMGSRITTWGVMVELNIPLQQSARRAQEGEAAAMVDAARSRSEAALNQLGTDLEEQLSALEAAQRNEALVQTQQLPQSELVLKSALAAYENGKVDFATLLDAQRQIRKARLDLLKAQVDAQMRLAEIERTVGETL